MKLLGAGYIPPLRVDIHRDVQGRNMWRPYSGIKRRRSIERQIHRAHDMKMDLIVERGR
jgi:hypothetical protein